MTLLTPRSTLFPYTTLFRSMRNSPDVLRSNHHYDGVESVSTRVHRTKIMKPHERSCRRHRNIGNRFSRGFSNLLRYDADRKSTRLNSSHGYISYAVFCLKKK